MLIFELFAFYGLIHRTDSFYIFIRNIPPHIVLACKQTCKRNHAMYIYFFLKSFAIQLWFDSDTYTFFINVISFVQFSADVLPLRLIASPKNLKGKTKGFALLLPFFLN